MAKQYPLGWCGMECLGGRPHLVSSLQEPSTASQEMLLATSINRSLGGVEWQSPRDPDRWALVDRTRPSVEHQMFPDVPGTGFGMRIDLVRDASG